MKRSDGISDRDSPAYEVLKRHELLDSQWRKNDMSELEVKEGNATPMSKLMQQLSTLLFPPLCCALRTKEVPAGCIVKMQDGRGGFDFLGNRGEHQGIHVYWDMFYRLDDRPVPLNGPENGSTGARGGGQVVQNGDCWIVTVPQGFVGLAFDVGQPILLPPGMHQWRSATMQFERNIDLSEPVIPIGPYTLLTVDKGYEAVTQNNGQQQVLPGGAVHLLSHRNWKFEKFISRKIQTDDLQQCEVMTGDNVLMRITATVCWQICDVQTCAERAVETMAGPLAGGGGGDPSRPDLEVRRVAGPAVQVRSGKAFRGNDTNMDKLRNDVLKQAEASLSALVGKVHFSSTFSAATALQIGPQPPPPTLTGGEAAAAAAAPVAPAARADATVGGPEFSQLFDELDHAVVHANSATKRYGVEILSINIISATPADSSLVQSLAKGAVAAAEAQQLETTARGRAKAAAIDARGGAEALQISAGADAAAEVTRAEGSKAAAQLLNEQPVAVQLAAISATGKALEGARSSLIFGADPARVASVLSNPHLTEAALGVPRG